MITFKQFLSEDADVNHTVSEAVQVYLANCKTWEDVTVPLRRYSEVKDDEPHTVRTRSPRERLSKSRGGTRPFQDYIFSQPGWEDYPPRSKSIFCSTSTSSALGETNLMIYPFDATRIGVASIYDLNTGDIFMGVPEKDRQEFHHMSMSMFPEWVRDTYEALIAPNEFAKPSQFVTHIEKLKAAFTKNGKFDELANGDEEIENNYDEASTRVRNFVRILVDHVPQCFTPERMGFELHSPATIDLSGNGREVWFSGKYLSIPQAYHQQFVEEVKAAK